MDLENIAEKFPVSPSGVRDRKSVPSAWTTTQWFVPILTPGPINGNHPGNIEGVFRDLELSHRSFTELSLGQEFRLVVRHEGEQPFQSPLPFFGGLFGQLLSSSFGHEAPGEMRWPTIISPDAQTPNAPQSL
jgi:hypothetical protein